MDVFEIDLFVFTNYLINASLNKGFPVTVCMCVCEIWSIAKIIISHLFQKTKQNTYQNMFSSQQ